MIMTTAMLLEKLHIYKDPFGKIRRMCENGELIPLVKGVYETSRNISGYLLAGVIYGPSYLSFNFALSKHGLIPEAVHEYTSATCLKGKKKFFTNQLGSYSYRDVAARVFSDEVMLMEEEGYTYWLATPEKALCDQLYALPRVKNQGELRKLLFEDMRIDKNELQKFRPDVITQLADGYHCHNVRLLDGLLRRELA